MPNIPKRDISTSSIKKVGIFDAIDQLFVEEEDFEGTSDIWYEGLIRQVFQKDLDVESILDKEFIAHSAKNLTKIKVPHQLQYVGEMVLFRYLPVNGGVDLDYYDALPLVIILDIDRKGILGLNLHYLQPNFRRIFLASMMKRRTGPISVNTTRMYINMEYLKTRAQFKYYAPCVRRYSFSRLRSRILQIYPKNWMTAIHIPNERFKSAKKAKIWNDSKHAIQEHMKNRATNK